MFTRWYVRAGSDLRIDLDHPGQAVGIPRSQTYLVQLSR